jgi:hypothetical protein
VTIAEANCGVQATEAKSIVSQLQQELTYRSIDASFDKWGDGAESSSSADSSVDPAAARRHRAEPARGEAIGNRQERGSHHRSSSRPFTTTGAGTGESSRHRRAAAESEESFDSDVEARRSGAQVAGRGGRGAATAHSRGEDTATLDEANRHATV